MFIVVLEQLDSTKFATTPLLQPLTPQLLKKPCSYLQKLALQHFRPHLSPFISANNLQLQTPSQKMRSDCPVFFYTDIYPQKDQKLEGKQLEAYLSEKQYVQTLFCKPIAFSANKEKQRLFKLVNNILLKPIRRQKQGKNSNEKMINRQEIDKINKYLPELGPIYINGKQVHLLSQEQRKKNQAQSNIVDDSACTLWSTLIGEKWDKYVSENGCMYILY